jgi:protein phosphatase
MRFVSAALSDVGRRRQSNEDTFAVLDAQGLYVVADGMGGHAAGKTASELAVSALVRALGEQATGDRLGGLRAAILAAHDAIVAHAARHEGMQGMGTTLAALLVEGDLAIFGHVGDSRIHVFRRGRLHRITLDHSLVSELVSLGHIEQWEARVHPHRNVITRALGMRGRVEPDLAALPIEPGDRFLLCTDGVTGQIEDEEIAGVLCDREPDAAVRALLEEANARGGDDNATAVLLHALAD